MSSSIGPAALGLDAGNAVADGILHDRRAVLGVDLVAGTFVVDIGDLRHDIRAGERPPVMVLRAIRRPI
jgi:hypothetical protein